MKKIILFLLTIIPIFLFGQDIKKMTSKENKETFYVLKSDKRTKHGVYQKFGFNNKLLVKGFYKLGVKDSIWECYDFAARLTLKYDFTKKEVVMYRSFNYDKDKRFKIINQGNSSDTTLSRPPIFLGGDSYILSEIVNNLRYPALAAINGKSGKVYVTFILDKYGKTSNYHVNRPIGYGMDEEAIKVLKNLPNDWLPGQLNGQAVDVEISYPISFVIL